MSKLSCLLLLMCGMLANVATAQNDVPSPVLAERLLWMSVPNLSGFQASWMVGMNQNQELMYSV